VLIFVQEMASVPEWTAAVSFARFFFDQEAELLVFLFRKSLTPQEAFEQRFLRARHRCPLRPTFLGDGLEKSSVLSPNPSCSSPFLDDTSLRTLLEEALDSPSR